ncbi:MAG: DUF1801 domain-containing protein [Candidatus Altiarchaeota archaeon]|nr:DUF1801 domain-containing protein [Candidatus Altiarchaeota archaeon]
MRPDANTVDVYIENLAGERRSAISRLGGLRKGLMPGFKESVEYGMPTYTKSGEVFAFASQKDYVSLYVNNRGLIEKHKNKLGRAGFGKNCIRYRRPSEINFKAVEDLPGEAYTS